MKKTPFLSYILAALLAGSAVPQAQALRYDSSSDCYFMEYEGDYYDNPFYPYSVGYQYCFKSFDIRYPENKLIRGYFGGAPIIIHTGGMLRVGEPGGEGAWLMQELDDARIHSIIVEDFRKGIRKGTLSPTYVYMEDKSALYYRHEDLWLGILSIQEGATVDIEAGRLVARSISSEDDPVRNDYVINSHINVVNKDTVLQLSDLYVKSVTLECDVEMNLEVRGSDDDTMIELNGGTLKLIDGQTSIIQSRLGRSYLGGTALISFGNGTKLIGYNVGSTGSWLLNNIEVREGCSASMIGGGFFGGQVSMQKGSSLLFDVNIIRKEQGGNVIVNMAGGNTLDLGGRTSDFEVTMEESTKNTLSNGTFAGSVMLTNGSELSLQANTNTNARVSMQTGTTLDMAGKAHAMNLTVTGTGNTMQNGSLTGTLTLEEGSYLKSDGAMASWDGPTSIVMKNGSKLEMSTDPGRDRWINDVSKLKVEGEEATVVNAYLRIKPGTTYTLGNGVENLKGERGSFLSLDNSTLDLGGGEISKLAIGVWTHFAPYKNVIRHGTLNTKVEIDPSGKLRLEKDVTLGANASFTMGNGSQLDLGGATGTAWLDVASLSKVTVGNGRIGLLGGDGTSTVNYTLTGTQGKLTTLAYDCTLNLEGDVKFATKHNTRFLVSDDTLTSGVPVNIDNIDVTAEGHFYFGNRIQGSDKLFYGNLTITHTGAVPLRYEDQSDVDLLYWLIGDLKAEMNGRVIKAGVIGDFKSPPEDHISTATITGASAIYMEGFTGKSMDLHASETVSVQGDAKARGKIEIGGVIGGVSDLGGTEERPVISFSADVVAPEIKMRGKVIAGTGTEGDDIHVDKRTWIDFTGPTGTCDIDATETISIKQGIRGGDLTMKAVGDIKLDLLGMNVPDMEGSSLDSADITSVTGGIVMRSFTGGALMATAEKGVTINGAVTAKSNGKWSLDGINDPLAVVLKGAVVSIDGTLDAGSGTGRIYIESLIEGITIQGNLIAGESSTLESKGNIISGGNVQGGNLKATAAQSITLKNIGINDKDAELTAQNGSITARQFIGGRLKATAKNDITINGMVRATGADKWSPAGASGVYAVLLEGGSVSIDSLTANAGSAYVHSTTGNITIGGTLSARDTSTLVSDAGNITIGKLDKDGNIISGGNVQGGNLKATAAQSITLKDIDIGIGEDIGTSVDHVGDAELTAQNGSIQAGSFTGSALKATAKNDITISGVVTATGTDKWSPAVAGDVYAVVLEGGSVSIGSLAANAGSNYVHSTTGNITIGGTLSARDTSTLVSDAGNITIGKLDGDGNIISGGNVLGGNLKATAAQSITLKDIGISEDIGISDEPVGDAELTAQNGSIQAGSFTGSALRATAGEALTISGSVEATGTDTWTIDGYGAQYAVALEGGSVSIGSLAANAGSNYVHSTTGDITIGGTLSAAVSSTLVSDAGNINLQGNVLGGNLTARAKQSITLKDIGTSESHVETAELTALAGSIKAGSITADKLQIRTQNGVDLEAVTITQTGQNPNRIISETGNVALGMYSGTMTSIMARQGSITVGSLSGASNSLQAFKSVTVNGSVSGWYNSYISQEQVVFNGAAGSNDLNYATIRAPKVSWTNGTTASHLTLTGFSEADSTQVTVGGSLELHDSRVKGDVRINATGDSKVTVDKSTITGAVSGTKEVELHDGSVGKVSVDSTSASSLKLTSSGNSAITAQGEVPLNINELILTRGGTLTVGTGTDDPTGGLSVSNLTVTGSSSLVANVALARNASLTFALGGENAVSSGEGGFTPVLSIDGTLSASTAKKSRSTITLIVDAAPNPGEKFALMSMMKGSSRLQIKTGTIFNVNTRTEETVLGSCFTVENNVLYFTYGTSLTTAVWTGGLGDHWDTTSSNWRTDDRILCYRNGMEVKFDDSSLEKDVVLDAIEGGIQPSDVLVDNSKGHDYTFSGNGSIAGDASLVKSGDGTLTIYTENTYSGGTTISGGTLVMGNAAALGTGEITLEGGTLDLNNKTIATDITVEGTSSLEEAVGLVKTSSLGNGELTMGSLTVKADQNLTLLGSTTISDAVAITLGDGAALNLGNNTIEANITLEGGASIGNGSLIRELTVKEGRQLSLLGNLKTVGNIILENNAALDLNGQTLSSGGDISRGQVHLSPDAATASIGGGTLESLAIVEGNQTLSLLGNLSGGGSILLDDKAGLDLGGYTLSNAVALGGDATIGNGMLGNSLKVTVSANHTLTLGGDLSGQGAVSLANGASLALNGKAISTRVILAGANATIGNGMLDSDLSVLGGKTLILGGDLSGQGAVSLANGATLNLGGYTLSTNVTLAGANATIGNGTIDNNLAVSAGNTLSLSAPTTVTGNLTLGNGTTLSLSLSGANTTTPALTLGGSMLMEQSSPLTINLTATETLDDSELYALVSMKDGKTPDFWNRANVSVSGLTSDPDHLFWSEGTLFYCGGTPVTLLTWTGSESNLWGGTDKNWSRDDVPAYYRDGVILWFDNGGTRRDLQLDGAYTPEAIMVYNDEEHGYSFSGPGKLTGSMQLTKDGAGTLAINTANDYSGGTTMANGTLVVGNAAALGTGAVTLKGGTLDLGGFTISNSVSLDGTASIGHGILGGTLTLERDGKLTLLDGTNITASTFMNEGASLDLGKNAIAGDITIGGGSSIGNGALNGTASVGENLTLTLLGDLSGKGSVSLGNGATLALNGNALSANLTLEGSATIGQGDFNGTATVGENQTLSLGGNVAGWGSVSLGNSATLALNGNALSNNVTVDGNSVTINQGEFNGTATVREYYTLNLAGDISGRGSVSLKNGATLALNGNALSTNVTVEGSATINQGALNGTAIVSEDHTLTLGGAISGTGSVILKNGSALALNGNALSNGVSLAGNASIGNGTIDNNLTVGAGYTLAFSAQTAVLGNVSLGNGSALSFTLSGENVTSPVLTVGGSMLMDGGTASSLSIKLAALGTLGDTEQYALVTMQDGKTPDFWNPANVSVSGLTTDARNIFWTGGTLYYCGGTPVSLLTWTGGAGNTWGGTDKNWTQGGTAYRYRDGVDLVFNNEGNNRDLKLAEAYAPKSVTVNNDEEHGYSFSDAENGPGKLTGSMQLTKEGSGTLTINNANDFSGGTTIKGGTLVMANAQALGSGTVTLEEGTLRLANGLKDFNLRVTGTETRLEGDWDNSFTGRLTLEEGSCLVSASAMANWAGPAEIVMKNGSTLKMVTGQDIWINDITNLHVEGEATMVDTFLRINPNTNDGVYTLGNGVQNIKGEGVTAYCLDGSIFDLDNHTTNLNIIVWNAQDNKYNTITGGQVDTRVEIHPDCNLSLAYADIGEHAQFIVQTGAHLDMANVTINDEAAFTVENGAYIDLGMSGSARLGSFAFMGQTATIDGNELVVRANEVARLGTDLQGTAVISLGEDAMLDLSNRTLDIGKIRLAGEMASVDNGTLTGNMSLDTSGKELRLGNNLKFESGNIEIQDGATLAIGNGCAMKGSLSGSGTIVKEDDGTSNVTGGMGNFSGSVTVLEGVLNLMNAASLNVQDVTIAGGTLGVYSNETPDADHEATLTIKGNKTLTAGPEAQLNANLVLERDSTLDVSATGGQGLRLGSTLTLQQGISLSSLDLENVYGLTEGASYNLFSGVDALTLDKTYTEAFAPDVRIDAAGWFRGVDAEHIYVTYDGSNVGLYCMVPMPEPTTGTLSLLALAALAARRRRK